MQQCDIVAKSTEVYQNVKGLNAPFAHHRGQVEEVGYGPQRLFINSWNTAWWNIRCGRLGDLAQASLTRLKQQPTKTRTMN